MKTGGSRGTALRALRWLEMTVHDFFAHWEMLTGRTNGPLTFRFVFQPTIASILAIRAGIRDAREGRAPYLWSVFTNSAHRHELLREGWRDIGTVFLVAILLDVVYALLVHRWIFPGQTLLVATILAIVPYVLIRGLVTRIKLRRRRT